MKTKILFDGNCIVCDREISYYARIAPELFEIIDISDPSFQASNFGLTAQDVNEKMHVITPEGELRIGVDAFLYIWQQLPQWMWLSRVVGSPIVKPFAHIGYFGFAKIRPLLPKKNR